MINSQSFAFVSTLCLRTSITNTPQLPSGSSDVINGFELSAPGLRRFYELTVLLTSDSPELLSSLSATAHYETSPRGQSYGGHYLFFIFMCRLGFFLNTGINCHLACFQVLVFKLLSHFL